MAFSQEMRELAARVSNRGRWGEDDQHGTANLITTEATLRGVGAVRTGERFSLVVPLSEDGIQIGQPAGRVNAMLSPTSLNERDPHAPGIWAGTDDVVTMSTCAGTHLDGLSHIGYDGELYGGRDQQESVRARGGARWCGVEQIPPIVTRGILLDVPRTLGVDELAAGTAITADDLVSALKAGAVSIESGDVACVRTGEIRHFHRGDRRRYAVGEDWKMTGLGVSCIEWLHDHDVAGVFVDNYGLEVMPPESGNWDDLLAVHMIHLRDMGMIQGQNFDFESLADACAADGRIDFLLLAAGEPIVGATSTPVHPVAVR